MMKLPAKYQAARHALAAARRVDEVKSIRDKALAMAVYAMQAKDAELVADSTEIRERATRRLGELMEDQRKAGLLAKSGIRKGRTGSVKNPVALERQGVDKNLADRARKAAALPVKQFETHVAKTVRRAVAAVEGNKAIIREAREERQTEKNKKRAVTEKSLAAKIKAMPTTQYGVAYADPPWRFQTYSEKTGMDRSADNHYPTMTLEKIQGLKIPAAKDSVLFLWATVPMLPEALETMKIWGFEYKSHWVWVKDKTATGYWNRNKHELLLVGTRGNIPAPAQGSQVASVIERPVGMHSEKPKAFRALIEDIYPTLPKIELFARGKAVGDWSVWGAETS